MWIITYHITDRKHGLNLQFAVIMENIYSGSLDTRGSMSIIVNFLLFKEKCKVDYLPQWPWFYLDDL